MQGMNVAGVVNPNAVGYLVTPSSSMDYLLLCSDQYRDLSFSENSLLYAHYPLRGWDGSLFKAEVLVYTGEMRLENPYNQNALDRGILSTYGDEFERRICTDQKYIRATPIACINLDSGEHISIGIPPSETCFYFVDSQQLNSYYRSPQTTFKFGFLSGTEIEIGLDIRHFGTGIYGWGDARMMLVAGRTGSGKTVLVGCLLGAYSVHKDLGILILDPQGQFSNLDSNGNYVGELGKNPSKWSWKVSEILKRAGRINDVLVIKSSQINFGDDIKTFLFLLKRYKFWDFLRPGIRGEKIEMAEIELANYLDNLKQSKVKIASLKWNDALFNSLVEMITIGYRDQDEQKRMIYDKEQGVNPPSKKAGVHWNKVISYFDPTYRPYSLEKVIQQVLIGKKIVIISTENEDDEMRDIYHTKLFSSLRRKAQKIYYDSLSKGTTTNVNALIIIDEAQRIIPEYPENDTQKQIVEIVKDSINTGRKLGIGWLFATQSVTNIDKRIWSQIGTKFIGYGFGTGADRERLAEISADKNIINRYHRMPMPLQTGKYWFMVQGELVGIGNGNQCLFIDSFSSQSNIFKFNPHLFPQTTGTI
jgi:hypothetical protein